MSDILKHVFAYALPPIQPIYSRLSLGYAKMATVWAVMQLVQTLFSEVLTVWNDQSVTMPPKALLLFALTLLCSSQLVKPVTVFLTPFERLLLEVCQRLLLIISSVRVLRQKCLRV